MPPISTAHGEHTPPFENSAANYPAFKTSNGFASQGPKPLSIENKGHVHGRD